MGGRQAWSLPPPVATGVATSMATAERDFPVPYNEGERLCALEGCMILDSPETEEFDTITKLAMELMKADMCLVSLLDEDIQWFKSHQGLEVRETPRSQAFCSHVAANNETLVVLDATLDPRFKDNGLVTGEPYLRFYGALASRPRVSTAYTLVFHVHDVRFRSWCPTA